MLFDFRPVCLWIHRYTGIAMAGFLIIAGITGTLLAFHQELDDVFNHRLAYIDVHNTPQLPIATLHDSVINTYPEHTFSSMPTSIEPGKSAVFIVDKLRDKKTKNQPEPRFQEVYVNSYTGDIIGTRNKDEWKWGNTMWKVFWLHRELLLGDIGKLILGIVALVWTLNCFIGFYLTFPRSVKKNNDKKKQSTKKRGSLFKRWLPAWKIRTKTNMFKLNYDLHHAFGLWLWLMFFVIAWSGVGFNLKQVYQPIMQAIVGLEPKEGRSSNPKAQSELNNKAEKQSAIGTALLTDKPSSNDAVASYIVTNKAVSNVVNKANSIAYLSKQAEIAAQKNGVKVQQLLGIRWVDEENQWQMRFKTDRDIGQKGGASSITVNAETGAVERVNFGYQSLFGRKTDQWMSSLHMGHISQGIGHRLYQIFLTLMGLAVTVLSATGVYLWWKGRRQRLKVSQNLKKGIATVS